LPTHTAIATTSKPLLLNILSICLSNELHYKFRR
jgi:hypothetical protein